MAVQGEWIKFGSYKGYLATPPRLKEPQAAVVVIQEVWGVEPHIEDVVRRLAAAGYVALAPDLFAGSNPDRPLPLQAARVAATKAAIAKMPPGSWRDPAILQSELAKLPASDAANISESLAAIFASPNQMTSFLPILQATYRYLAQECPASQGQPVGCIGFCMGGALAAILACEEPTLAGAALFYGSTPPPEKLINIHCPVIAFYGENDPRVNAGIPALADGLKSAGQPFEHFVYPGAAHGFFNDSGASWQIAAARDAWARSLDFFRRTLT